MKVIVDKGVVDSASNVQGVAKLHRLFGFACEGRHALIANPPGGFDAWLGGLDETTRHAYQSALQFSTRTAATLDADTATVHVCIGANSIWDSPVSSLVLDEALELLGTPLGVLVENAENDWNFLCRIMRPSEREKVLHAVSRGWAEALHGGGATLGSRLRARAEGPAKRLRTFVIFDSDRRHPEELLPDWAPTAPEACQGFILEGVARETVVDRFWRLNRRSIESYLPRVEITAKASSTQGVHPDAIDAFFRMATEARWFFNMKRGFSGDRPIENAHRSKNLYGGVSPGDKVLLESGFGRGVADQYKDSPSLNFSWDTEALEEAATALPRIMRLL